MITWCVMAALAADWSPSTWGRMADRDGVLRLPAGEPLRLEQPVPVTTVEGLDVALRAGATDWWIDAAPLTRYLRVAEPVGVKTVDDRQWDADWAAWEHDAARALASDDPLPVPPDGITALSARAGARARAVGRRTALLGLLADVADHRGLSRLGRRRAKERRYVLEPGETRAFDVHGAVRVGVRPMVEAFTRLEVGIAGTSWSLASSGVSSVYRRVVRARDAAPLVVEGDAEVPVEVLIRADPLRLWAVLPGIGQAPGTGLERAEWAALHGEPADFTPWLEDPDPDVAVWARVRAIETAEGARLLELCDPAVAGPLAVAHAVLGRAADLPVDVPLAWRDQAVSADPRDLAAWLDGQQGTRPHGVALLERARAGRVDPGLARDQVRHSALFTRWAQLDSDRDDEATWRFATAGAGVPRLEIVAGQTATFTARTAHPDLREAVRWTAAPGTRFLLDGALVEADGPLRFGLEAGAHRVEVLDGRLLVPRDRWEGGRPGVGWRAVPLPARFVLPGRGASLELRVQTEGPVTLVFDDGRVVRADGARTLLAGPYATGVEVRGDGAVGLAARILRVGVERTGAVQADEALETVRRTTLAVDAGNLRARAERSVALAQLGHRRLAWTDVAALAAVDGALHRQAWSAVASVPVVTGQTGPLDAASARALGRADEALALELLEAGDRVGAVRQAATTTNEGLLERALAGMRWQPVQRFDRGAGLTPVELSRPVEQPDLRDRVEQALIASPWPASETVVVREGAVDRITTARTGLEVAVWCRDLSLQRAPCALEAIGATTPGVVVGDGREAQVAVDGREAEIGPVDEGQVVVVRATDAEGVVTPAVRRLAVAIDGVGRVRLPPDRLVRFRVLDGQVTTSADVLAVVGEHTVVDPRGELVLRGRGTVLVAVGRVPDEEDALALRERPARPRPNSLLTVDDLWPTLPRSTHRDLPSGPSTRVQMSGVVALDGQFRERWTTGELLAGLYRTQRGQWVLAEGWIRGPGGLGFTGEVGVRRGRQLLSVRAFGATTLQGDAGEIGVRGHGRLEAGPRSSWLRLDVWPRAAWVSLQPRRTVDPKVWTRYRLAHFAGVDARLSWLSEPTRDLRLRGFVEGVGNVGASLDRVQLGTRGDLLLRRRTRVHVSGRLDVVFADLDRNAGRLTPFAGAGVDHDWWIGNRRWMLFLEGVGSARGDLTGQLGLSVHGTRGRGLRDLPPTRDLFRTEREGAP
jgi:hypothetical protein